MPENTATGTTPADITAKVIAGFDGCEDARLRELMQLFVRHLHGFATEAKLTEDEWQMMIETLTATGDITDEQRQEFILWSDSLGLSMLVDALANPLPAGATESTVLGPFYVPGSPLREYGADIAEQESGVPAWVEGRVIDVTSGEPVAGAEVDVWQNGDNRLYAVQDPDAPEYHLRGRFITREDGGFAFLAVRPVPYPIPDDGPVGKMLGATGRHPWRPAHIHMVVRADGFRTLVTHIFDAESEYLESDTVFAVKPSLVRRFEDRAADDPERPEGVEEPWCSLRCDLVLAPGRSAPVEDSGRTA
ncbi:MAG: dioxygenase [Solirubrobacterales bacterium]